MAVKVLSLLEPDPLESMNALPEVGTVAVILILPAGALITPANEMVLKRAAPGVLTMPLSKTEVPSVRVTLKLRMVPVSSTEMLAIASHIPEEPCATDGPVVAVAATPTLAPKELVIKVKMPVVVDVEIPTLLAFIGKNPPSLRSQVLAVMNESRN